MGTRPAEPARSDSLNTAESITLPSSIWSTAAPGPNKKGVSVHRAPHLLCCRALEVQKYVCAPDALHLRHPVNAYNYVV